MDRNRQLPIPPTSLLRQWAKDTENTLCWGLDVVADEMDRMRRELDRLREMVRR